MKKIFIISMFVGFILSGCVQKNEAYKNLKRSPCACFQIKTNIG
ncbi:hypothetical protein [Arcobacter sp. CECT 8986]|nr:hypothetical protein [Arcobacter sp. CECT 8986]